MCKSSKRKRSTLSESDVFLPAESSTTYNETYCVAAKRVGRSYSYPNTKEEFDTRIAHLVPKKIVNDKECIQEEHNAVSSETEFRHGENAKTITEPNRISSIHNIRTILTIIYAIFKSLKPSGHNKSLRKCHHFSKVQNDISTKYNKHKNGCLDFLFQLQRHPLHDITTCPVSLSTYFDSLTSGHTMSQDESMSNNLLRISSYSSFPRHVNIFTSLLSKAGFYYTGHADEVRCYACGLTHKHWKSGDDPLDLHRRMSPSCSHVISLNSATGSIHRNENNPPNNLPSRSRSADNSLSSAKTAICTGPSCTPAIAENEGNTNSYSNGTSESIQQRQGSMHNGLDTSYQNGTTGDHENIDMNEDLQSSLGIEVDKPRYPNYAPLPVRISSFQGWPSYLDQTAYEMAVAGFLYAGYQDYTRCFFCGGGLRNWEAGDDPWIEHARWFPKCTFLKQNKGERFIRAVQEKQEKLDKENNSSIQSPTLSQNANPTNTDQPIKLLDSVAAKSVMEMGYTKEDVFKAIQKLTLTRSDVNEISATNIMTILLNDDDDESSKKTDGASASFTNDDDDESSKKTDGASASFTTSINETQPVSNGLKNGSTEAASERIDSMMDDVEHLVEENRQLKDLRLCKVCLDFDASIAFLPCGHMVCCADCAPAMRKCPMCRAHVKGTVKTFLV